MFTAQKGDILYHKTSGRPSRVVRTRKVLTGSKLEGTGYTLACGDWFVISAVRPESAQWTATSTPELARRWAEHLECEARDRAAYAERIERDCVARLEHRDRLNAEPEVTPPHIDGDDVRISATSTRQTRTGDITEHTAQYAASIFAQSLKRVGEDGEYTYVREYGVNWSALGTQSPAIARAYARAILAAADLADERNATPTPEEN